MINTNVDMNRPTQGVILTLVVTGLFAVALSTFFVVSPRDVIALSVVYGVFVAMCIGIGMALLDVVKYFEGHRN